MVDVEKMVTSAMENFAGGYNCTQSVVLAYEEFIDLDREVLATISAPLGGGMGRLREVCGAVSGMFMVSGFLNKNSQPNDNPSKKICYEGVQCLATKFSAETGSIVCRELLGLTVKSECPTPSERTEEYYKKRPCKELVGLAARLVGELINEKEK